MTMETYEALKVIGLLSFIMFVLFKVVAGMKFTHALIATILFPIFFWVGIIISTSLDSWIVNTFIVQ